MKLRPSFARLLTFVLLAAIALMSAAPVLAQDQATSGEITFIGVINTVPAAAGQPWVIAGINVAANAQTRIRLTGGAAAPGMWADVGARRLQDGTLMATRLAVLPPEIGLKGPIQAKPADPSGVGDWTIAGQTIAVTADTKISTRAAPLDVGNWAQVFAEEQTSGPLKAKRMLGLIAPEQQVVQVYGAIQSFGANGWVLSSIPISVTTTTTILSTPKVGLLAETASELPAGSTMLVAEHIRVAFLDPSQVRRPVQFTGEIQQLPGGNLNGTWQVAGRQVEVTDTTFVHQERGPAVVGAQAVVIGWQDASMLSVTQIMVMRGPTWGANYVRADGQIHTLPSGSLLGTWTVGAQQITVNANTRVEGSRFARANALAQVGALAG